MAIRRRGPNFDDISWPHGFAPRVSNNQDDPKLEALQGTWEKIFDQSWQSPAGLTLSTSDLMFPTLADFVAFFVSDGALPKAGHGRCSGLVFHLLAQLGDQLSVQQKKMLQKCELREVPLVKGYQIEEAKKQRRD